MILCHRGGELMVYVVQEPTGKNIIPALDFGEIKILLSDSQITFSPEPYIFKLQKKLKDFSDEDYLLLVGDPVAIALAAMIAGSFNDGKVKFLKWDRQEKKYVAVNVNTERRMDARFN